MERITKDEAITLENNKEYYVVEIVEQDEKRYLYLVKEEEADVIVAEEIIEGEEIIIETLDDIEKIKEIVKIVTERLNKN
ncbi:MAG: hypothetical protein PHT75_03970 [Bacilli bacterium]|nr:hypothetical protein [Bacilli bacterium]MDD3305247.1 hypothetical protein [Bacilli bacterium]MDD4053970.1 hypothetical protein [Bacilli bacterium]MDD4411436.1 hypothetical protein [Bacilli bacterium]